MSRLNCNYYPEVRMKKSTVVFMIVSGFDAPHFLVFHVTYTKGPYRMVASEMSLELIHPKEVLTLAFSVFVGHLYLQYIESGWRRYNGP